MAAVEVRSMTPDDEYFVATCTHVNESEEIDACARSRSTWMRAMYHHGLRVAVALLDGEQVGFVYVMPIEVSPWGPLGSGLATVPCLTVREQARGKGAGRALMAAAEAAAVDQGHKGIVTTAFHHDFWFMQASFFERMGYSAAATRDTAALMWKRFDSSAEAPSFLEPRYEFTPVEGRVVVDLFWNTFCETSWIEAKRVREVAADFGDAVVLNEHCADDHEVLLKHQLPRAIFVNGQEIGWGYEAPKEGVAEAISRAMACIFAGAARARGRHRRAWIRRSPAFAERPAALSGQESRFGRRNAPMRATSSLKAPSCRSAMTKPKDAMRPASSGGASFSVLPW